CRATGKVEGMPAPWLVPGSSEIAALLVALADRWSARCEGSTASHSLLGTGKDDTIIASGSGLTTVDGGAGNDTAVLTAGYANWWTIVKNAGWQQPREHRNQSHLAGQLVRPTGFLGTTMDASWQDDYLVTVL